MKNSLLTKMFWRKQNKPLLTTPKTEESDVLNLVGCIGYYALQIPSEKN